MIDDRTIRTVILVALATLCYVVISSTTSALYVIAFVPGEHPEAADALHGAFENIIGALIGLLAGVQLGKSSSKKDGD